MISAYVKFLTFITLQIRSFLISWSVREASYLGNLKQKCSWHDVMISICYCTKNVYNLSISPWTVKVVYEFPSRKRMVPGCLHQHVSRSMLSDLSPPAPAIFFLTARRQTR